MSVFAMLNEFGEKRGNTVTTVKKKVGEDESITFKSALEVPLWTGTTEEVAAVMSLGSTATASKKPIEGTTVSRKDSAKSTDAVSLVFVAMAGRRPNEEEVKKAIDDGLALIGSVVRAEPTTPAVPVPTTPTDNGTRTKKNSRIPADAIPS